MIDPRTQAVRPDLADVRLADRVFAPHYAEHVPHVTRTATALRAERGEASAVLAELSRGEAFEVLDVTGGVAWGSAPAAGLVGYVPVSALEPAA